jgi:hypothetical protein
MGGSRSTGTRSDHGGVTAHSASGARAKLRRARRHLTDLEEAAKEYLASDPFQVYTVAEPERGPISYRVHVRAEPPEELGLMLGDALHNARSALDHVACLLVEQGGGTITQSTAYPINNDAVKFRAGVKARLMGATDAARDAVVATAAYRGGDDQLWALHQLDIDDKHKLLIPVDMFLGTVNLHYGFRDMQMPPFGLRPADVIRLQEGAEVLHIAEAARFTEQGDFTNKYSFTFDLALDSPALLGPRPVHAVPTAQALIDHAEAVAVALLDRFG